MKIVARLSEVTIAATMALALTLFFSVPSMAGGLNCEVRVAQTQVTIDARIIEMMPSQSKRNELMDILIQCPKAADTQGQPAYIQTNIDLTLDANVTNNRNFDAPLGNGGPLVVVGRRNITDALLIVNDNTESGGFTTPNYLTGPSGVGQSPQYGLLVGSKNLQWNGVFLPVPGVSGNPDVTTLRITNIRANIARPSTPVAATLRMNSPGSVFNGESGFEWRGSIIAAVPMPLPNPPAGFGLVSAPTSAALKLSLASNRSQLSSDISSAGIASAGTRLALQFTNIPSGASVWLPPVIYLFRQGSAYSDNIQSFDVATTGIPNLGVQPVQSPAYQIPYGNQTYQTPYGYPLYPNPYGYGERGDRGYDDPQRLVIPWEIPPGVILRDIPPLKK